MSDTIQWFPGHMNKARRQMEDSLKLVDMVIEIRDARIPYASANPLLDHLIGSKPRLIILSKKDKADAKETLKWLKKLNNANTICIAIDAVHDKVKEIVIPKCKEVMASKIARMKAKGMKPRAIRAMVVGIPNVGKSTFINSVARKKVAKAANQPGVTQALQWIKLDKDIELLDTPGVLWPKFDDKEVANYLALCKAIKDEVLNLEDIAVFAVKKCIEEEPDRLASRYGIEINEDPYKVLEAIGRSKNLLMKNGEIDMERVYIFFLSEAREDKLGPVTWEKVKDEDNQQ